MLKNLTISEFEAIVTTRVLAENRLRDKYTGAYRTRYSYSDAQKAATYVANDIFKEIGISDDLWCMVRRRRTYIFHMPTNRIAAELGIVTDDAGNGERKHLRVVVLDRKGYTKYATIGDMDVATHKLGVTKRYPKVHPNHLEIKEALERRKRS